jgi:hypothetical protein
MSIIFKKKSSTTIFQPPSYIKGKSEIDSKVQKIINETIKSKIFDALGINKVVYIKITEYFQTYTTDYETKDKSVSSFMLRVRNGVDKSFKKIPAKEIEFSGINVSEFEEFLIINGAKKFEDVSKILETI